MKYILVLVFYFWLNISSIAMQKSRTTENQSGLEEALLLENSDLREKRALGVILQAFGYAPSFQIGSLPNPNTTASNQTYVGLIGRIPPTQPTAAPPTPPITYPPGSTIPLTVPTITQLTYPPDLIPRPAPTTAAPKPAKPTRETLKFTGVVNFGNNSNLLGHLQQYEQLFHTSSTPAPSYSPPPPRLPFFPHNSRFEAEKLPRRDPFMVKIPIPLAPSKPVRKDKEEEYSNKQNFENYAVESKEIVDPREVNKVPYRGRVVYEKNPHWKEMYGRRVAELMKQMEEDKSSLEYDDNRKNYEKSTNSESDEGQFSTKEINKVKGQYADNGKEERSNSESSIESNYDDKLKEFSEYEEPMKEFLSKESDDEDGYFYSKKELPLNYNREQIKSSETLKNSYGEQLENEGVLDERVADYFPMFKSRNSENKKRPWVNKNTKSTAHLKQPIRVADSLRKSKYEEYDLTNSQKRSPRVKLKEHKGEQSLKRNYFQHSPLNKSLYVVHTSSQSKMNVDMSDKKPPISKRTNSQSNYESTQNNYVTRRSPTTNLYKEESRKVFKNAYLEAAPLKSLPTPSTLPYFDFIKSRAHIRPIQIVYNSMNQSPLNKKEGKKKNEDNIESFEEAPSKLENLNVDELSTEFDSRINQEETKEIRISPLPFESTPKQFSQKYRSVNQVPTTPLNKYRQTNNIYNDPIKLTTVKTIQNEDYLLIHPMEDSNDEKSDEEEIDDDKFSVHEGITERQNTVAHTTEGDENSHPYEYDLSKSYGYEDPKDNSFNEHYFNFDDFEDSNLKNEQPDSFPKATMNMDEYLDEIHKEIDEYDKKDEQLMKNAKTKINNKRMIVKSFKISSKDTTTDPTIISDNYNNKYNYQIAEHIPSATKKSNTPHFESSEVENKQLNSYEFGKKIKNINNKAKQTAKRRTFTLFDNESFIDDKELTTARKPNSKDHANKFTTFKVSEKKKITPHGTTEITRFLRNVEEYFEN